jgi:hypothetical protein
MISAIFIEAPLETGMMITGCKNNNTMKLGSVKTTPAIARWRRRG